MVAGDFNAVATLNEYSGPCSPDLHAMSDFNTFLLQCSLHEIPVSVGTFTWTGVRRWGRVWKKLDRMVFNSSWLTAFAGSSVQQLHRATSDHNPLLLKANLSLNSSPRPFRFQKIWLHRKEFKNVVFSSWNQPLQGFGMFKLATKLKRLKGVLRVWNKEKFGNVISNLQEAEKQVKRLEEIFDSSGSNSDLIRLNEAKAIHLRSMAEEETFWQQKARMKWLQESDQNTKLFYNSVVVKHVHLSITCIKNDNGI